MNTDLLKRIYEGQCPSENELASDPVAQRLAGMDDHDRNTLGYDVLVDAGLTDEQISAITGLGQPRQPQPGAPTEDDAATAVEESEDCPPLPGSARLPESLGRDASPWLDEYVRFSALRSPRSFPGYYVSSGIFALTTVAARRVRAELGHDIYTPLYLANVGRSSIPAKTTAGVVIEETLNAAGLGFLLLSDDITPQKFLQELSGQVPENYDELSADERELIRLTLAFTGQRGWFIPEFGQQLNAMSRRDSPISDWRGLLRIWDDCRQRYRYSTVAHGQVTVVRPYLALLANMTYEDVKPHGRPGASMWGDGFWARFGLTVAPEGFMRLGRLPTGRLSVPQTLTEPLAQWHRRLGIPDVRIENVLDASGRPTGRRRAVVDAMPATPACTFGAGVIDAYYNYMDALVTMIAGAGASDGDSSYGRFAQKAMRVAMLLGSLENGGLIELPHWARAQSIVEGWRAGLHTLIRRMQNGRNVPRLSEAALESRVLQALKRKGACTPREVSQQLEGVSSPEARELLEKLVLAGTCVKVPRGKTEAYDLAPGVEV
jgi:hypothetical protein